MSRDIFVINEGHFIEGLDRCHCVQLMIENMLIEHPLIISNEQWLEKVAKAQILIAEVYQEIGTAMET